ncbi:MAG: sulfurtransferase complex subunit TusB [Anaerolineae bacterium]|nr:sulfurtransferase complex subunit TusB [Anaerolineae bacterium]
MLYTVNKSPLSTNSLSSVLRIAPPGAPVLLYEDGVYAAVPGAASAPLVQQALAVRPVYALDADLEARGLVNVIDGITVIGYDGFVELVEQHDVAPWI